MIINKSKLWRYSYVNFEIFMENIKKTKAKEPLLLELEHDNMPTMDEVIALQNELFSANRSSWLLDLV